jgi:hypothetical protein
MSFDDGDTTESHELRIQRCRSCNAKIIWFKTESGKNMPVDADTVEAADDVLDLKRHKSHFATCPNANAHRRQR